MNEQQQQQQRTTGIQDLDKGQLEEMFRGGRPYVPVDPQERHNALFGHKVAEVTRVSDLDIEELIAATNMPRREAQALIANQDIMKLLSVDLVPHFESIRDAFRARLAGLMAALEEKEIDRQHYEGEHRKLEQELNTELKELETNFITALNADPKVPINPNANADIYNNAMTVFRQLIASFGRSSTSKVNTGEFTGLGEELRKKVKPKI
jgi:hypothetical protein